MFFFKWIYQFLIKLYLESKKYFIHKKIFYKFNSRITAFPTSEVELFPPRSLVIISFFDNTFFTLFSITIFFLYGSLDRSISVKIMIYLYFKKNSINMNNFYKTEFKGKSFDKRIKLLIGENFLIKKNKNFFLSSRGKKYLEIIKIIHSIYGIKSSG